MHGLIFSNMGYCRAIHPKRSRCIGAIAMSQHKIDFDSIPWEKVLTEFVRLIMVEDV